MMGGRGGQTEARSESRFCTQRLSTRVPRKQACSYVISAIVRARARPPLLVSSCKRPFITIRLRAQAPATRTSAVARGEAPQLH